MRTRLARIIAAVPGRVTTDALGMKALLATSAAMVASLGLVGAMAHGARTQRLAGTIAFLRDPGGTDGSNRSLLYVIHPDGSGLKRVTPPASSVLRYAWSPNGRLIAYIDERRHSLWLIRRNGTRLRRLLSGSRLASEGLSWSPDGTKIAITSQGPYAKTTTGTCPGPRIYVVPIHRTQPRVLRGTSACGNPAWSPWGNQIAYNANGGIWVIRADGSGRRRVSPRGRMWVRWSADGRQLAFGVTAGESFYGGPAAVDADGRHYHLVTRNAYTEYPAEWSPQGRRILYGRANRGGIYVIGADGKHDFRVTRDWPTESVWPALAWAPDGMSIVYARHTGHGDLYVVGADGHGKVQLTNSPDGDSAPSWVAHAGAWTAKTASVGPTCSASDNRNERTIGNYRSWERYCGPGRAVLRLDGKVFRIKHGTCHRSAYSVGFGLIGWGDKFPDGRGMVLHLSRAGDMDGPIRAGRNSVIDGEVQLPGYGSLPHTGHAIVAKHVKSGTFSLGSRANPVTGRFSCG